jgi:tetratricopeptide (TPR) repeat protein
MVCRHLLPELRDLESGASLLYAGVKPMKLFSLADTKHIDAAEGWLELGNFIEAVRELDRLSENSKAHPEALEVRWKIFSSGKLWNRCLEVAEALTEAAPERATSWLYLAHTLHQLDETEVAYQTLLEIVSEFACDGEILYQLACYACLVGEEDDARQWLNEALEVGGTEMKKRARANPELKALWQL